MAGSSVPDATKRFHISRLPSMSANSTRPTLHAAHFVQFSATDDQLIEAASRFARDAIESDCTCLVIATPPHRQAIDRTLARCGLDTNALVGRYRYASLDAATMLSTFMVDGEPDQARFHRSVGLLVWQAASRGQPVHIFGEMVALLAAGGCMAAALKLEELWNELSRQQDFTLFCAYPLSAVAQDSRAHQSICAVHSHVLPTGA